MGINSTEVSYGFGQMGSAFTNLAKPIYPPKDPGAVPWNVFAMTKSIANVAGATVN